MVNCVGLIGFTELQLETRLGSPISRREISGDVWLVFRFPGLTLRARCRDDGDGARCASWTVSFLEGVATLAEAAASVGLWPEAGPDEAAEAVKTPLIRRSLPCTEHSLVYSLTAAVRANRFTQIAVFDEAPDWH